MGTFRDLVEFALSGREGKILVYRIENQYGQGPHSADRYGWSAEHAEIESELSATNGRPTWYADKLVRSGKYNFRAAFESMEALYDWFTPRSLELLRSISAKGDTQFFVATYEVNQRFCYRGKSGKQIVFHYGRAKLIRREPI